jgi:ABC-type nitrate/sulfonate/bicarbonate transport system permease component
VSWSRRVPTWVFRSAFVLLYLVIWEVYGRTVNRLLMSYPTDIVVTAAAMARQPDLWRAFLASAQPFTYGLVLAVIVGIVVGALMGRFKIFDIALAEPINMIYVIPPVALIPVVMMWFGLNLTAKTFIVFLLAVFPILYNTYDGTRAVSRNYVEIARSYGASEWQTFRDVTLFSALPFIMSGFRQATGRALIGLIVAELFTSLSGLGSLIALYSNTLETAKLFVVVIVLGIVGMSLMQFGAWLERRLTPWKQTERAWK